MGPPHAIAEAPNQAKLLPTVGGYDTLTPPHRPHLDCFRFPLIKRHPTVPGHPVRRNRELPGGSESDKFQADPLAFLKSTYGPVPQSPGVREDCKEEGQGEGVCGESEGVSSAATPPPDFAVMYDTHLARPGVTEYLRARLGLEPVEAFFNAHVNGDADSDDTYRSVYVLGRVTN